MSFVGDFEGASAGHLVENRSIWLVLVRNQVAVQVVVEVRLGDLVAQSDSARDSFGYGRSD
jgi:hypothetical protein